MLNVYWKKVGGQTLANMVINVKTLRFSFNSKNKFCNFLNGFGISFKFYIFWYNPTEFLSNPNAHKTAQEDDNRVSDISMATD